MLIYANKREMTGVDLIFFLVKRSSQTIRKSNGRKSASESSKILEKTNVGSIGPTHLVT